jgi:PHD/YefM family antitoxin component YafN of YafNO toxin-antitoxin module
VIDSTQDVRQLNAFYENSTELIAHLKRTRRAVTLLVDDETQIVVQEASAYRRLLDAAAEGNEREGVRQGDEDVAAGRTRLAKDVFEDLRRQYGLPG